MGVPSEGGAERIVESGAAEFSGVVPQLRIRRMMLDADDHLTGTDVFDVDGWEVVSSVRNPWGRVPLTDGGRLLAGGASAYMNRLVAQQHATDSESRRHHYVPKAYLREWSFDSKRVWTLDTVTGVVKPLGIADVCVK